MGAPNETDLTLNISEGGSTDYPRPTAVLWIISLSLWISYRILGREFNYSNIFAFQNFLLLGFIIITIILCMYYIFIEEKIIINEQLFFLSIALLIAFLSTTWSNNVVNSLQKLKFELLFAAQFFIMLNLIRTTSNIKKFIKLVWVGILIAILAVLYGILILGGIRHHLDLISFYASIGLVGLPISLHFYFYSVSTKRIIAGVMCLLSFVVVAIMQSRMAIIAFFVFLMGIILFDHNRIGEWHIPRKKLAIIVLVGATGLSSLLLTRPELFGRFIVLTIELVSALSEGVAQGEIDSSYPGRAQIYLVLIKVLTDPANFVFGVGWGNFAEISGELTGGRYPQPPHNMYFKYLTNTGIVGLVPFAISTIYAFRYASSSIVHSVNKEAISLGLATFWSLVMLVIFFQTHPLLNKTMFYLISATAYALYTDIEK